MGLRTVSSAPEAWAFAACRERRRLSARLVIGAWVLIRAEYGR